MSEMDNTAIVIHGAGDIRVESRPEPIPGDGEAQVVIERGGICGSDLSYYRNGAVGDFRVKHPMVLGHEVVGTVRRVGPGAGSRLEGTRVVIDPSDPCGRCDRCRDGRSNACHFPTFLGSASTDPHVDGGFSSLLVSKEANLVPIPDGLASSDAVFAEPLAVTLHAIARAGGVEGKRVLVVGAGPIGSMAVAAASRLGAADVVATDLDPGRLSVAATVGATATVEVGRHGADEDGVDEDHPDEGYDLVIEASGSVAGIASAFEATRRAGQMVLVGLPHGGPVAVPLGLTVTREIDVFGSFRFCHDEFVQAVELLADGLDLSPLLTGTHGVGQAGAAFEEAVGAGSLKVQLDFGAAG